MNFVQRLSIRVGGCLPERQRWPALALTGAYLLAITAFVGLTLAGIMASGFRQPALDQFRMLVDYLGRPFPENLIQLENGHRPIIPALVRVFELYCCAGNLYLQLTLGTALALLAVAVPAISAWREPGWSRPARLAAVLLATLMVLWFANARMLLHGHESVHAYLVIASVGLASVATWRAARGPHGGRWLAWAILAALAATFSFGPGIAAFPMVILLAWLLGLRGWRLLAPVVAMAVTLWAYLFVLPGDEGVRGNLHFVPLENLVVALRWSASPWVHAWLGSAEPDMPNWLGEAFAARPPIGTLLRVTAGWVAPNGVLASPLPLVIGMLGHLWLAGSLWTAGRRPEQITRTAGIGLGLALFAAGVGAVIALGRVQYFQVFPDQIFADRYLLWPCLFWGGLLLFGLAQAQGSVGIRRRLALTIPLLLAVLVWPSQLAWMGLGQSMEHWVARSEPAARLGIFDPLVLPDNDAARREQVETAIALMREREVIYFRRPLPDAVPQFAVGPETVDLKATAWVDDGSGRREALRLEGWSRRSLRREAYLVVLDGDGGVRGLVMPTHASPGEPRWRGVLGWRRGLDGYLRFDPSLTGPLDIVLLGEDGPIRVGGLDLSVLPAD